jgi:soluble lytic murein transglycosylase-like protein
MATPKSNRWPFGIRRYELANASNYALRKIAAIGPAIAAASLTFARDIARGASSTARLLVMAVGSVALLAAGVLASSEDARSLLEARLWPAEAVAAAPVEVDQSDASTADERARIAANDPQQKRVVQYLARRYRVADGAVRLLVATAFQIGKEKNLDPLLILSVVAIESSLNPFAESAMGAQGLMQVMTRVHAERFQPHGGETAALDPIANMKVGSSILHELISRGGSVERGLQLYVGAGNMPDDGGYGVRVLGERARLQMAATGKVDVAIAAAIRAAAAPAPESKPAVLPVNADLSLPPEPTRLLPSPNSTGEAHQLPAAPEHSV